MTPMAHSVHAYTRAMQMWSRVRNVRMRVLAPGSLCTPLRRSAINCSPWYGAQDYKCCRYLIGPCPVDPGWPILEAGRCSKSHDQECFISLSYYSGYQTEIGTLCDIVVLSCARVDRIREIGFSCRYMMRIVWPSWPSSILSWSILVRPFKLHYDHSNCHHYHSNGSAINEEPSVVSWIKLQLHLNSLFKHIRSSVRFNLFRTECGVIEWLWWLGRIVRTICCDTNGNTEWMHKGTNHQRQQIC